MNQLHLKRWISGLLVSFLVLPLISVAGADKAEAAKTSAVKAKVAQPSSLAAYYYQIQKQNALKVVELVNKHRKAAGLKPLIMHETLSIMAKDKAIDMHNFNYFSHQSPHYGSPFDMMDAYRISYRYAGENIAKGQRSSEEVVRDWMNSPGHKANIMNKNYTLIGVGYYNGCWVQAFIGK